jgi:hypothetical protein
MSIRWRKRPLIIRCAVPALALAPGLLQAYVGPGVGLSAIGSVLAFIGAIFLLIVGFLWYPIKRLLRGRSGNKEPAETTERDEEKA